MNPIKIDQLNWSYDEKEILKGITLNIEEGKFTGIIGPNGSGKTTVAKLISKLLKTSHETVYIDDKDLSHIKVQDLAKRMALVQQSSEIDYDFTSFEVVMLGRTPHLGRFDRESKEDYEIVKRAMTETDTWQYKDRLINHLSGGERQRVIIAKALAQEPKILVLDEPVTYLDVHHQYQIMELVKKLSEIRNITIVIILHDLNYALKYCDYVALLNNGEIYKYGKPEDVITLEHIKKVYHIDVNMITHPITNTPHIIF